jgi:hypothetical protein
VGKGEWQYEPKWDGFRCLAFKAGDHVELRAKSGKSLSCYFPEVVAVLRELKLADAEKRSMIPWRRRKRRRNRPLASRNKLPTPRER